MTRLFTIAAMSCMAVASVFSADVLTEEEWKNSCRITPNPEATTATEIGPQFKIAARNTKNFIDLGDTSVEPTLDLPDGDAREGLYLQDDMDIFTGRVTLNFAETFDMAGKYVLTIPEGAVKLKQPNGDVIGVNPELTYEYSIIGKQEPLFNPLTKYEIKPASGSTVANIYKNISITFPDLTPDVDFHRAWIAGVSCSEDNGEGQWQMYDWDIPEDADGVPSYNTTNLYFRYPIDEPGDYTVKISRGVFRCVVPDPSSPTGWGDVYSPEIILHYTVGEIGSDEITLATVKTDPDNKETVTNFDQITLIFPNSNAPEQGIKKGTTPFKEIYMRNEGDARTYYCQNAKIAADRSRVTLSFHGITDSGDYKLVVPADVWQLVDAIPVEFNAPMEIPFHLSYVATGIDGVDAEAEFAPVYDLNGRVVLDNATEDDVNTLPAGCYIRAGKKLVVIR